MARRLVISSSANPRLKALRRLARTGSASLCVAEGRRAVAAALAAGRRVRELYVAPEIMRAGDCGLVREAEERGVRVIEVGRGALSLGTRRPEALVATLDRPGTALRALDVPARAFVAVAVGIERPGNLGAIVRTACAAGVDALLVADPCTDLYHPEVVRSSVGAVFRLRAAIADTPAVVAWLRERGVRLLIATPAGDEPHWQVDVDGAVALVFGSERHGLPDAWLRRADARVAIPMPGAGDSLNVAVAAGVMLFEATRRRSR